MPARLSTRLRRKNGRRRDPADGHTDRVDTGAQIVLAVVAVTSVLVVLALFVWAALKDGQEDKALQKRLRIRRRTRLGR
jgi:hypothetical protein